jgi:hypothetical protein
VYEPGPRLFAGGNPRDRQTGGLGGAVAAVVLLVLGSGLAALYSIFVFPFAGDNCDDSKSTFICTATGLQVVVVVPLLAATVGSALAACALAMRPRFRALGITLGYVIGVGGFLVALIIASAG